MRDTSRAFFFLIAAAGVLGACGSRPVSTVVGTKTDVGRSDGGSRSRKTAANSLQSIAAERSPLRIGLKVAAAELRIEAERPFEVRDGRGEFLAEVRGPASLTLRADSEGFVLREKSRGSWEVEAEQLQLTARDGQLWTVDGDHFEGSLNVLRSSTGAVTLVEEVSLERYLEGVVPWEIGRPDREALAAVQAQAIAARTYAYAHLGHWKELGFDLRADVGDQVYRGRTGTSAITDEAVRTTRGQVLVAQGRLIRAYYSSTCGGFSSNLADVWDKEGANYLVGGPDRWKGRTACASSGQFRWTETWSARELGEIIRAKLPGELGRTLEPQQIGILQSLKVLARDRSGRVQRLLIETDRDRFELWGDRIRWVLSPARGRFEILRSTLFELREIRREGALVGVQARGGGFGHGVGLCQTGALQRARWDQSVTEILEHYYPGARVVGVRSLGPSAVALR
jgi:stage II sporulation protein D (peptidoglycan lytic transglycosylase)